MPFGRMYSGMDHVFVPACAAVARIKKANSALCDVPRCFDDGCVRFALKLEATPVPWRSSVRSACTRGRRRFGARSPHRPRRHSYPTNESAAKEMTIHQISGRKGDNLASERNMELLYYSLDPPATHLKLMKLSKVKVGFINPLFALKSRGGPPQDDALLSQRRRIVLAPPTSVPTPSGIRNRASRAPGHGEPSRRAVVRPKEDVDHHCTRTLLDEMNRELLLDVHEPLQPSSDVLDPPHSFLPPYDAAATTWTLRLEAALHLSPGVGNFSNIGTQSQIGCSCRSRTSEGGRYPSAPSSSLRQGGLCKIGGFSLDLVLQPLPFTHAGVDVFMSVLCCARRRLHRGLQLKNPLERRQHSYPTYPLPASWSSMLLVSVTPL
ncbi:hypothetical protein MSAN_02485600 [Mycena sanguinolenta]|uniref:Uncharacterized protein n=1 Tax=Mycena sanguinolenta TaxID=230812 RepID=A0A8H6U3L3_9AGAR|nr:hypothetical protein MSAN_02485600 [Mycena sanguinolenta]